MPDFTLTLYSRSYCHLCDDMMAALDAHAKRHEFSVEVVDVDANAALVALYDERVPVLMGRKGSGPATEICHYFLDHAKLSAFLAPA